MKIKICGITSLKDAELASSLGADFLGFIFYLNSKRNNSAENVRKIIDKLKTNATPVAVFVNEDVYTILRIVKAASINTVQLHGSEDDHFVKVLKNEGLSVIKTIHIKDKFSFNTFFKYSSPDKFLLDTWQPDVLGGSGKNFDWNLLTGKEHLVSNAIIAGGLNASNVKNLLKKFNPWCIDVASAVEKSPGIKDPKKMKSFFEAARG